MEIVNLSPPGGAPYFNPVVDRRKVGRFSPRSVASSLTFLLTQSIPRSVFLHNELIPLLTELFKRDSTSSMLLSMIGMESTKSPSSHFLLFTRAFELLLHFHANGLDRNVLQEVQKILKKFSKKKTSKILSSLHCWPKKWLVSATIRRWVISFRPCWNILPWRRLTKSSSPGRAQQKNRLSHSTWTTLNSLPYSVY